MGDNKPGTAGVSLHDRIASTLKAAGHTDIRDTTPEFSGPAFIVCEGAGATVGHQARDMSADDRERTLADYASTLQAAGFEVSTRHGYLFIIADQEEATRNAR